ncbi:MAG TPA: MFS transporter [Chloroflexota bacterium]|nr:MFS transporter [Chloroflexota bacterium]
MSEPESMKIERGPVRIAAYWGFIVLGAGNTILGPALLSVLGSYHIAPSGAGPLFVANTVGYTLAVLVGGPASDHFGKKAILVAGAALYLLGLACFAGSPLWITAILAAGVIGLGGGVIDSGSNAMMNDIAAPEKHATEQSYLHTFFGIGALLGPLLIGACLALHGGWRPAWAVAAIGAAALVSLFARLRLPERRVASEPVSVAGVALLARDPLLLLLGLLIGAYVGAEVLVGDWAATFLERIHGMDKVAAATSVSLYWGGLAAGRLLSGILTRWCTSRQLLIGYTGLSVLATLALVGAPNVPLALAALTLTGLGYAAVFPLVMAVAGEVFPAMTGSAAGLLIAAASVMGAIFPWIGGVLVQYADSRAAMLLALPATLVQLAIALVLAQARGGMSPTVRSAA